MKRNLLILGKGSHSHVIVEQCRYGIPPVLKEGVPGPGTAVEYDPSDWSVFVAIGSARHRKKCLLAFEEMGYDIINIISDRAYVSPTAELGKGIYVAPMACIQSHSIIGDGCIINTHASVDHDCELGPFVHIAPGVHMGGTVTVGEETWIGVGSSINDHINIGKDIMVGSGSVIVDDLRFDGCLYMGHPAVYKGTYGW